MKYMKIDRLQVFVADSREEMGRLSGHDVAAMIKLLLSVKEELNVMFAAAPSQNDVLATLVADPEIDWSRVNAFHLDEYIGLSRTAPQGFGNFLRERVFDKAQFRSVNYINPEAINPAAEADRYEALLLAHPMDVCILGIGENGHVAFNDPGEADFNDARLVKPVHLDERCRQQQVNDGCFASLDEVPKMALTVTVPGLLRAKAMFCIVPTTNKAEAVKNTLERDVTNLVPATIMKTHPDFNLFLDSESAAGFMKL